MCHLAGVRYSTPSCVYLTVSCKIDGIASAATSLQFKHMIDVRFATGGTRASTISRDEHSNAEEISCSWKDSRIGGVGAIRTIEYPKMSGTCCCDGSWMR